MSAKHTPGPWRFRNTGATIRAGSVKDSTLTEVAFLPPRSNREADACLITAAPDLLDAAKKVLAGLNARIDAAPGNALPVFDGIADLYAAIAKAEGGGD